MKKNQNVVEDALFQIKNLEEALQENAKGILHSTMKEEIKQLVKESLNEQEEDDEEEVVIDDAGVSDDTMPDKEQMFDDEEDFQDDEEDFQDDEDESFGDETIDLTGASDDEVLKVFKAMGDEDGIIVKKEDGMLNLKDGENEYMIQLGESEEDFMSAFSSDDDDDDDDFEEIDFSKFDDEDEDDEDESIVYEIVMDEDTDNFQSYADREWSDEDEDESWMKDEEDETWKDEEDESWMKDEEDESWKDEEDEDVSFDDKLRNAIRETIKPKGVGMGSASKFKYDKKPNMSGGFNTKRKEAFGKGTKAVGTGKAKFEYKEGESKEGWDKVTLGGNKGDISKTHKGKDFEPKKMETKEASRTLGNGKRWGREGLDKPKAAPRHLRKESINSEIETLREKNEEYKKALDVFRTKLNEVAVFNSNLAYATRLFTEHSTTKQEKINILRRFDSVESLKESKNLYRSIKEELGSETKGSEKTITESIERNVVKTPTSGSATSLIESKTYENPQFLRMKDLMGKLK